MSNQIIESDEEIEQKFIQEILYHEGKDPREEFPKCSNISAGMLFYKFIPRPFKPSTPEFVRIPFNSTSPSSNKRDLRVRGAIAEWNICWEAAQVRSQFIDQLRKLPPRLRWLQKHSDKNIYLLPGKPCSPYYSYAPLYHLLGPNTLKRFGLPPLKHGFWPFIIDHCPLEQLLPNDCEARLSQAFAYHIWPLLSSGSGPSAFSKSEPLRVLAHNLDFWMPYSYQVSEEIISEFGRCAFDNQKQAQTLKKLRHSYEDQLLIDRPFMGGTLWQGEEEAWEVTRKVLEKADSGGKLRGIIEAVRSNRVEEDFSSCWSYAREDFERKLYHKRSKVKVKFVELDETIPVHGPDSEVHENLLWQDFLSLLDVKERQIVVLLRKGVTKMTDIGKELGYATHSPVSKSLKKIRKKALELIRN